jgi:hypothetical protein
MLTMFFLFHGCGEVRSGDSSFRVEDLYHGVKYGFEFQSRTALAVKFLPNLSQNLLAKQGGDNGFWA